MCNSRPFIVKTNKQKNPKQTNKNKSPQIHSILSFQMSSQKVFSKSFYLTHIVDGHIDIAPSYLKKSMKVYNWKKKKKTYIVCIP